MAFTVSGRLKESDRFASVTWADDELTGDVEAIVRANSLAIRSGSGRNRYVGHVGDFADLRRPLFALYVLGRLFEPGTVEYDGDLPSPPPADEGSIY